MLPISFDTSSEIRSSRTAVGVFAIIILTAGFAVTALLCFAVKDPLFQLNSVFWPSLISCAIGILTIPYNFVVYTRYTWNTPALLLTIATSISTAIYAAFTYYTHRKLILQQAPRSTLTVPLTPARTEEDAPPWQEPAYYTNYIRNMYPSSSHQVQQPVDFDQGSITEEEMQRQQMLMLLLKNEQLPSTPGSGRATYHIDWQGREEEDGPPVNGYYAPPHRGNTPVTYPGPLPPVAQQWTNGMQPWDGVWRTPARVPTTQWTRADSREERRREIEMRK